MERQLDRQRQIHTRDLAELHELIAAEPPRERRHECCDLLLELERQGSCDVNDLARITFAAVREGLDRVEGLLRVVQQRLVVAGTLVVHSLRRRVLFAVRYNGVFALEAQWATLGENRRTSEDGNLSGADSLLATIDPVAPRPITFTILKSVFGSFFPSARKWPVTKRLTNTSTGPRR